jgi:hypothetical protein
VIDASQTQMRRGKKPGRRSQAGTDGISPYSGAAILYPLFRLRIALGLVDSTLKWEEVILLISPESDPESCKLFFNSEIVDL